jgi:pimeloyl-ACP methyl ester carboxylesterase
MLGGSRNDGRLATLFEVSILFCHGLESGPHGRKFHALVDAGFAVQSPDCRGRDLETRVDRQLHCILAAPVPPLVVGSSFGGISGLLAALLAVREGVQVPGLVLCAPALRVPRSPPLDLELRCPAPTIVVHGRRDEVIPIESSRQFAHEQGSELIEVDDDHSLAASLPEILDAVRRLGPA